MSQPNASERENSEAKLPRRDWILLPMLSLLTVAVCFIAAEVTAKHFFASQWQDTCLIDSSTMDSLHRPNCSTRMKTAEGPWVTNQYNDCGYRTKESCGPKPLGSKRIALIGSSGSEGLYVEYQQTFAARTASDLTQILGRPVEVQNLGRTACFPICVFQQTGNALALQPDLLMMAIDPYDIEHLDPALIPSRNMPIEPHQAAAAVAQNSSFLTRVNSLIKSSVSMVVVEHFVFQNTSTYARIYLHYGDHADYLRTGFSPAWDRRFDAFEILLAEMAEKANAANVPFVLIELPSFAQASLSEEKSLPPGVDPYAFNARLKQISSRHGVQFVNGLDAFKGAPGANELFYVAEGHMTSQGHAFISRALVEQLTKEQSALLSGRNETNVQALGEQGK
jgi:hypothetical protein